MEAAYQVFANALMIVCPADFDRALLVAEVEDDWSEIRYDCEINGQVKSGLPSDTKLSSDVDDALHELRTTMTQEGLEPWSKCTFTLLRDGQFKFDVGYDD